MTNINTSLQNTMNDSDSQNGRKRKVSEPSSSESSESDSGDHQTRVSSELRKLAKLKTQSRFISRNSENSASSSTQDISSDSSSESEEKCPICLKAFKYQTLGITDTCSYHTFCLSCLKEWSKTRQTCPVDRKEYESILVLDSKGNVADQLPIKAIAMGTFGPWPPPYEPTFCEVCGLFNNEEVMLICNGCGTGYHLYCLAPPMETIPHGIWLCNDCWCYYNY